MSERVPFIRRRSVLVRGAAGLAAALAVLVGRSDSRPQPLAVPAGGSSRTFELYGRGWTSQADDLKFGQLPGPGERYAVHGDLADAPDGKKIGDFASAVFTLTAFGNTVEMHTLNLPGGSVMGMGSGTGHRRTFAIVGGTGKFTGARGSYTAEQSILGFGGNGTAKLSFTLAVEE